MLSSCFHAGTYHHPIFDTRPYLKGSVHTTKNVVFEYIGKQQSTRIYRARNLTIYGYISADGLNSNRTEHNVMISLRSYVILSRLWKALQDNPVDTLGKRTWVLECFKRSRNGKNIPVYSHKDWDKPKKIVGV